MYLFLLQILIEYFQTIEYDTSANKMDGLVSNIYEDL
jgi:hypothetical protein